MTTRAERQRVLEWSERLFGKMATLPDICLQVRAGTNGSAESWEPDLIRETLELLRARLALWEPTLRPEERAVDDAVRRLVEATIEEVEFYRWWQKPQRAS